MHHQRVDLCACVVLELLHTISISQRVERVLAVRCCRTDVGNHDGATVFADERVLEHLCQLAATERRVFVFLVQCTYALLQRQQRLVDLGAFHACLFAVLTDVSTTLAASQIDETEFQPHFVGGRVLDAYGQYGV